MISKKIMDKHNGIGRNKNTGVLWIVECQHLQVQNFQPSRRQI